MKPAAPRLRVAVVGGGWAGLSAAVRCVQAGREVSLFEMAATLGGRARSVVMPEGVIDNGQHILIGAYTQTLDLMRTVDVNPDQVLARMPLSLVDAKGQGLKLPPGAALPSFARGIWSHPQWSLGDRMGLLWQAMRWGLAGYRCVPDRPVSALCAGMPQRVMQQLIEPLCVAALNTQAHEASAAVFLRVLRDAMFSGRGSADLLLPRRPLGDLLPDAASRWLAAHGAQVQTGVRVRQVSAEGRAWRVDGCVFDQVILACSAREAARLCASLQPDWAAFAEAFAYEPIITAWLDAPVVRAPFPMLALAGEPAQFAFDLGALGQQAGRVSLVVSGARHWVDAGGQALEQALHQQIQQQLATVLPQGYVLSTVMTEKRATFRCTPGLRRPPAVVAPGLSAAGDYVEGPYPATLEGAVRSGEAAAARPG